MKVPEHKDIVDEITSNVVSTDTTVYRRCMRVSRIFAGNKKDSPPALPSHSLPLKYMSCV